MRTPGNDLDLAAGFLWGEGIIASAGAIARIAHAGPVVPPGTRNIVCVELEPGVRVDWGRLERHFYTTSSCGVCGKTAIEAVYACPRSSAATPGRPVVAAATIHRLPEVLRDAQAVFERTGGLHAAALFEADGRLVCLREDVGRHNAVDKVIGAQLRAGAAPPLDDRLLLVSGRASFELVQKAVMAGIPILAAVGAPSSLAAALARDHNLTLLGFVRNDRFNIYAGPERIRVAT